MRPQPNIARDRRPAFTLVELLVVISLIIVIAAIGIMTVPLFQAQQKATFNASAIVSWLGGAKVQALKEQRPTGMRFIVDQSDPANQFIREMYYVQTPDDYTGGMGDPNGGCLYQPNPNTPTMLPFLRVDFFGGLTDPTDYPVQPGDYLEINGGGLLYQIVSVPNAQTLVVSRPAYVGTQSFDPVTKQYYTTIWRIIRQPRRLVGQDTLTLYGSVAIDLTNNLSQNVPTRVIPATATAPQQTYYEIVFAPNGGVVGRGTNSNDRIILYVRDSAQTDILANDPVLISVQVRTGFIGSYQVNKTPGADPYSFARDPSASGM